MFGECRHRPHRLRISKLARKTQHSLELDWGLGSGFFSDQATSGESEGRNRYTVRIGHPHTFARNRVDLDAVAVRGRRRFGNSVTCLGNAIAVAKALGLAKVVAPGFNIQPGCVEDVLVTPVAVPGESVLEGSFYKGEPLYPFFRELDVPALFASAAPKLVALHGVDMTNLEGLSNDELVIHLRSGDIFSERARVNPNYGQPPLSFYQEIVQIRRWRKVWVVFENGLNPVISPLISWLAQQRISFEISSSDWKTDISLCLRASHLVGGRGTFLDPVLWGSIHLSKFYTFENPLAAERMKSRPHIALLNYVDCAGNYKNSVLTRWKNSLPQRELMVRYPSVNIRLA